MSELSLRANAKINLFLEVLNKRPDGYHNIETVFQSIDLYDVITLRENKQGFINVRCDNPRVPLDSSNIVYKAAELLLPKDSFGVNIEIAKNIPLGAGLAGGSADAAATLIGLNELFNLGYSINKLYDFGRKLGADVPFCIMGGTALGCGRGDELIHLPSISEMPLVIVNPGFQVSTPWAYGNLSKLGLTRKQKNANILIEKIKKGELMNLGHHLYNIFESVVIPEYPEVLKIKEELIRSGSSVALMTGSGPTVFGLTHNFQEANAIRDQLKKIADFCIVSKTSNTSITMI